MEGLLVIQLKLKEYAIEVCALFWDFRLALNILNYFPGTYVNTHIHTVTHPSPLKNHIFLLWNI